MKFVSAATLLALAVATQATPLFDLPEIDLPRLDFHRARTVTKVVYVTAGRDVEKPTNALPTPPAKDTKAPVASPSNLPSDKPANTDIAPSPSPPAETGTVVAPGNWVTSMVCRINAIRAARGAQPLGLSSELNALAQQHSQYQNSIGQMTHSNPAGGVGARLSAAGISWSTAAENVAVGMQTGDQAQDAWEKSSGHLANMVNPSMTYVGAGQVNGYWTQIFYGVSGNAPASTIPKCN
ncbi:hypothetical protein IWW37_001690 [Coemansia sp. RSA 2050]|nr:hypothetical protein IWW37_001690 [Coemansia sp. RSA 2050]KAJ2735400.1 hypothetical protein IW152_001626 [Coemansia sp. BCRC 34962]